MQQVTFTLPLSTNQQREQNSKETNHTYLLAGVEYWSTLASCIEGPIFIPG